MKALVYGGPGRKEWKKVPDPEITDDRDAIVRVDAVTICGTDLHILKGDVPETTPGRILGRTGRRGCPLARQVPRGPRPAGPGLGPPRPGAGRLLQPG